MGRWSVQKYTQVQEYRRQPLNQNFFCLLMSQDKVSWSRSQSADSIEFDFHLVNFRDPKIENSYFARKISVFDHISAIIAPRCVDD